MWWQGKHRMEIGMLRGGWGGHSWRGKQMKNKEASRKQWRTGVDAALYKLHRGKKPWGKPQRSVIHTPHHQVCCTGFSPSARQCRDAYGAHTSIARAQPSSFFYFIQFPGYIYLKVLNTLPHDIVILQILLEQGHILYQCVYQVIPLTFVLLSLQTNAWPRIISFGILPQRPSFFCTSGSKTPFTFDRETPRGH